MPNSEPAAMPPDPNPNNEIELTAEQNERMIALFHLRSVTSAAVKMAFRRSWSADVMRIAYAVEDVTAEIAADIEAGR